MNARDRKPVQVVTRKLRRKLLKRELGSNNIRGAWRKSQVKRYGFKDWLYKLYFPCNGKTWR
jgi:hypothetical protein